MVAQKGLSLVFDPFRPLENTGTCAETPAHDPVGSPLDTPSPPVSLYVSGRGLLLRRKSRDLPWYEFFGDWYRVLTADVYLWLREQLWAYAVHHGIDKAETGFDFGDTGHHDEPDIEAFREIYDFADNLVAVKREGIHEGVFTPGMVAYEKRPPASFVWKENFPDHLDHEYFPD